MAKSDFKNAAAKLLEKHSSQAHNLASKPPEPQRQPAPQEQPKPQQPQTIAAAQPSMRPVLRPVPLTEEIDSPPAPDYKHRRTGLKAAIMMGLITVATAIMVLLVPKTILGIGGNIGLGILAGGAVGYIINREIK